MTRKLVVPAVFLFALAYSFITAPFRGADEFNHFFRAYHVSTGRILAHRAAYGVIGGELPASLLNLATLAADFPSMPDIKLSAVQFRSANRSNCTKASVSLPISPTPLFIRPSYIYRRRLVSPSAGWFPPTRSGFFTWPVV